ncbi:hypothetical protein H5410_042785 [Solanum commersonii]|uniref:Uncharacterized protein n=1 Tax=Solanum commersonii TaxID=4109 RepID=A0A9J5XXB9_SOLCO|nr:hypothetical protein H5410_042785 [Solanum commersonii]
MNETKKNDQNRPRSGSLYKILAKSHEIWTNGSVWTTSIKPTALSVDVAPSCSHKVDGTRLAGLERFGEGRRLHFSVDSAIPAVAALTFWTALLKKKENVGGVIVADCILLKTGWAGSEGELKEWVSWNGKELEKKWVGGNWFGLLEGV